MWAKESSVAIKVPGAVLVAQQVDGYVPPSWPGTAIVHLDLTADDLGAAGERAVELGAKVPEQPVDSRSGVYFAADERPQRQADRGM